MIDISNSLRKTRGVETPRAVSRRWIMCLTLMIGFHHFYDPFLLETGSFDRASPSSSSHDTRRGVGKEGAFHKLQSW